MKKQLNKLIIDPILTGKIDGKPITVAKSKTEFNTQSFKNFNLTGQQIIVSAICKVRSQKTGLVEDVFFPKLFIQAWGGIK